MLFLQRNTSEQSGTPAHYANKTTFLPAPFLSKADFHFVSNQKRISYKRRKSPHRKARGERKVFFLRKTKHPEALFYTYSIYYKNRNTNKKEAFIIPSLYIQLSFIL